VGQPGVASRADTLTPGYAYPVNSRGHWHVQWRRVSVRSLLFQAAWFTVIGLKLAGVIGWSWWWILLPVWGGVAVAILVAGVLLGLVAWSRALSWRMKRGLPKRLRRQMNAEMLRFVAEGSPDGGIGFAWRGGRRLRVVRIRRGSGRSAGDYQSEEP
jgi:hypothetical protein